MYAVIFFYLFQLGQQVTFQLFLFHVLAQAHVEMQHGVLRPFGFQTLHGQSFEQVPPSFEIGFQSACQQRLAEATGTAQEYIFRRGVCHAVHMLRLVDIQIILIYDFRKGLYPDGIESACLYHSPFLHVHDVQKYENEVWRKKFIAEFFSLRVKEYIHIAVDGVSVEFAADILAQSPMAVAKCHFISTDIIFECGGQI